MGKKRVVLLKKVKKPCLKKDGVVAKRAEKKPLKLKAKPQEVKKTVQASTIKPARLNWVGSKRKKRDTDKERRRRLPSLPTPDDFAEVDDLRPDFYVSSEAKEMRTDFEQDRITGDDGLCEEGRYGY